MAAFAHAVLGQVYARVVSPESHELRNYEAFSNNVYGEILPPFTSRLFRETGLTSARHVFVDLGSGVGNCTLQAALELGCESWGCEIMEHAAELARRQRNELAARARLFGVRLGRVRLLATDFAESKAVADVLKRADVVLVNNYVFDAELNGRLVNMFLDLRDGTRIVSLKSFVPPGHAISRYNVESPVNMLAVEEREFYSRSVSWTDNPGRYFVSTVDRSRIQRFLDGA
ncbi:histone methylation DOT1 [Dipodascopsis tothii]|uniref:histone methylation DOT1 n=1 Tax=Dipodascopsis tothii TaxID=44089 RepID=UPI0034CE2D21